jgi:O-antigen ligase
MTYSGVLMLVIGTATARLVFGSRDRLWPALVMPALVVALSLTLTRGAWVGAALAVGVLLALRNVRLTVLVPIAVALVFVLAPSGVTDRMKSTFDLNNLTVRDRLAMVQVGTAIVRERPLAGVGPNMVPRVYTKYRPPGAVERVNPHLHNVPLQIAAERGLPALAVWGWLIVALALSLLRLFRRGADRALPAAGLAAVVGMLGAGLTEYNFGDSEFLMLFLLLCTLPFAASREDG